jgi:hypothetical protein
MQRICQELMVEIASVIWHNSNPTAHDMASGDFDSWCFDLVTCFKRLIFFYQRKYTIIQNWNEQPSIGGSLKIKRCNIQLRDQKSTIENYNTKIGVKVLYTTVRRHHRNNVKPTGMKIQYII